MPWCDECDRFYTPSTLSPDGECPEGHPVAEPPGEDATLPWHFWLLLAALVLYLGWRLLQLIGWLIF